MYTGFSFTPNLGPWQVCHPLYLCSSSGARPPETLLFSWKSFKGHPLKPLEGLCGCSACLCSASLFSWLTCFLVSQWFGSWGVKCLQPTVLRWRRGGMCGSDLLEFLKLFSVMRELSETQDWEQPRFGTTLKVRQIWSFLGKEPKWTYLRLSPIASWPPLMSILLCPYVVVVLG